MTIDLGHETVISPRLVRTPAMRGWVAEILGLHPKYELKREFLGRVPPQHLDHLGDRGTSWHIPHPGLYEYRDLGDGSLCGFFVVTKGFMRLHVALISNDEAHVRAAQTTARRRR
ncbi:hypothetical protein ACIQVR_39495 [Streptomyces xanthochromogenes]|uniref:hypothetical protein n=1 Tax=Streptomyces xanthochromogenes TaxID=67384 RepID=UPI0037F4D909